MKPKKRNKRTCSTRAQLGAQIEQTLEPDAHDELIQGLSEQVNTLEEQLHSARDKIEFLQERLGHQKLRQHQQADILKGLVAAAEMLRPSLRGQLVELKSLFAAETDP